MEFAYSEWKLFHLAKSLLIKATDPFAVIDDPQGYSKSVVKLIQLFSIKKHREYIWREPKENCKFTFFQHNLKKIELEYLRESFPME